MNVLDTEWWSMAIPPEWWADAEDDSVLVGDRDDVGCIQISTLHRDSGEFGRDELAAIAQRESEQTLSWEAVTLGEFAGVTSRYREEDSAMREWYVASGSLLLFITYSCDTENEAMDDAAVNELLDTLMVLENAT
ncbi:hypothetical protein [Candidatus Marimicrobium litorale]|uniref:DUF3805 domain-containing protein n=1 Tax=Candidatus Marimicrobium litorale TaxID=2518991 RepID=A0ABT3T0H0_9GAMM|nr:hypothetical protein [Candidatus Marimicrobium litorale]MCX2975741.1 hypothetical protein [Candidatus Marimicrobium litorale]